MAGQAIFVAKGSPSEVGARPATEVVSPSVAKQAEPLVASVAATVALVAQLDGVPLAWVEVMVAATDGS